MNPVNPLEPRIVKEEPARFLARVRDQSCYKSLRVLIDIMTALIAIAGMIYVVCGILLFGGTKFLQFGPSSAWEMLIAGIVLLVIAVPYRQGSVLLVDLVDMHIERGRKEWNFDQPLALNRTVKDEAT